MSRYPRTLCPIILALLGCEAPERPGELVGRYDVTGELMRNDCGAAALPAADPLLFQVEIRDDQGVGLWYLGEPPGIAGTLEADGAFRFKHDQQVQVVAPGTRTTVEPDEPGDFLQPEPDVKVNRAGCQMRITETVEGALYRDLRADGGVVAMVTEDGEVAGDLVGTNRIEVSMVAGSDCSASLASQGGPFESLPCSAEYDLVGALLDP